MNFISYWPLNLNVNEIQQFGCPWKIKTQRSPILFHGGKKLFWWQWKITYFFQFLHWSTRLWQRSCHCCHDNTEPAARCTTPGIAHSWTATQTSCRTHRQPWKWVGGDIFFSSEIVGTGEVGKWPKSPILVGVVSSVDNYFFCYCYWDEVVREPGDEFTLPRISSVEIG